MSRATRAILVLSGVALLAGCAASSATQPAKYALVYGISLYIDALPEGVWPNLTYSNDDAESMSALLKENDYTVTLREDSAATLAQLRVDIDVLRRRVDAGDLVLFYYSGHGALLRDLGFTAAETAGYREESAWAFLYGSVALSGEQASFDLTKAVYDTQLDEMLSVLPCAKKVVVIDACQSGGFVGSAAAVEADDDTSESSGTSGAGWESTFSRAVRSYGEYLRSGSSDGVSPMTAEVLTACGASQLSWELTELGHGLFTYYFMEAATEGDLNGDGYVTALEAYAYALARIDATWNSIPGGHPGYRSVPRLGGGAVDYVIF
jgi:uncharacterized caspase-like protein